MSLGEVTPRHVLFVEPRLRGQMHSSGAVPRRTSLSNAVDLGAPTMDATCTPIEVSLLHLEVTG